MIEDGQKISAVDCKTAVDGQDFLNSRLDAYFDHYDRIMTPATNDKISDSLKATGNPIFNIPTTYYKMLAITLLLMEGPNRLPLGVC